MQSSKERVTLFLSCCLYLLFNLRLAATPVESTTATLLQILHTAPYVAGVTWVLISFLQYMAGGEKMPWDRRVRLFLAIGIMAGLVFGIYEYAGVSESLQQ
jgi:hypothetical protein